MNRLESLYLDKVDFIHLNVDNSDYNAVRSALLIRGRAEYILYDGDGTEIGRWFGNLNVGPIVQAIDELVAN